ncbi:hypothetical protein BC939DRAFT_462064 [Gamsiella multidivaricata]|uniref:uncharacterized protein n=1 Tax=Gamsiella multidivaricata TaxID=101098 RepID=UPI002220C392|nr:uncharacterized protein BC939DRAFT_462064 [Gamsiella multidivaricata]KAI7818814.1 hypothetical protein BC939DRAFT_462064 [Gamsiella multidivaricata]
MEPIEDPPQVAKLRSLLNRSARIEITDGRLFVGQFMCIDHSKNIILAGAYESRPLSSAAAAGGTGANASTVSQDIKAIAAATSAAISASNSASASGAGSPGVAAAVAVSGDSSEEATPKPRPGILKRNSEEEEKRFVGQIMIPGHHIVKAEMDCSHLRGADSRLKAPLTYNLDYLLG